MNEHRWRSRNNKTRVGFVCLFVWCHGCDSAFVILMSKITESRLASPEHESHGDVTEEECTCHDSTRKYELSLSLSESLSCGELT